MSHEAQFDQYAVTYDDALGRALKSTGEPREYYATGRIRWLSRLARRACFKAASVLDFGCGDGNNADLLDRCFSPVRLIGVDVSSKSIEKARCSGAPGQFSTPDEFLPRGDVDLAYCNGVFHHIARCERQSAVEYVLNCLRPGGWFAFWENNPWNPGTRYVMANCAFDHDAITLSPMESTRMLRGAGFEIVRRDSLFYFPAMLKWLRPLEAALVKIPLGGQYFILCRKPAGAASAGTPRNTH